ncbi:XdhC family protein [Hymenobacter cellulosivorans]|uniref:XdhC family protein n=1 Tax=Hymenobacter cellulosivorans TaxID=2932249 RepID=A0ABY4FGK6_9BACT|nr:XdhC/CoxI family protein [Hymenobacter cellulosivorans]UOQ55143.1 XdhC family protein [Hymenobacter cellulosivorans]
MEQFSATPSLPRDFPVWQHVAGCLHRHEPVTLLCVLSSSGSSPGRQGFKMSVSAGSMAGSIGGGIMEHKFVELARARMLEGQNKPFIRSQIHRKEAAEDRSGMICSGEQVLLVYPVQPMDLPTVEAVLGALRQLRRATLRITATGLTLQDDALGTNFYFYSPGPDWQYHEQLGFRDALTIVGGGHVALALSRVAATLDFEITVLDDRAGLNTHQQNPYAHHKRTVQYDTLAEQVAQGPNQYVVIMTFGYRPDEVALRQLLTHQVKYLGLMGSGAKIKELLGSLRASGYSAADLDHLRAPIGLSIHSRTPEEIAISVAAELIQVRNAGS